MASRLFALDGVQVAEVDAEAGGGQTVWVVTADPQAAVCPGCGTASGHVKEYVVMRPADLCYGQDRIAVVWVKRRLECREPSCPRKTFTESVAQVPPRLRGKSIAVYTKKVGRPHPPSNWPKSPPMR